MEQIKESGNDNYHRCHENHPYQRSRQDHTLPANGGWKRLQRLKAGRKILKAKRSSNALQDKCHGTGMTKEKQLQHYSAESE